MNGVKRSEQAISAFIFLSKYCETEKCDKCVFNTGGVGTKQEYGCGLVAALSDHRRFSTVLERAINRGKELEHDRNCKKRGDNTMNKLKSCPFEEPVGDYEIAPAKKPKTNFENVISSPEKLANFIYHQLGDAFCFGVNRILEHRCLNEDYWLEWLKQEAKSDS